MKSKRLYALVFVAGLAAGAAVQSFAASTIEQITAYINHSFKLTVDGEQTELPEGYEMLVYQNRTYVPVRAIGEMVGAEVDWDDDTKTVIINRPTDDNDNVLPPEDNTADKHNYKALPQTQEGNVYRLAVLTCSEDLGYNYLKLNMRLTGLNDNLVRIIPTKTKYLIDGVEYSYNDTVQAYRDTIWYTNYAGKDESVEGYIVLPPAAANAKTIHVEITVAENSNVGQTDDVVEFDIAL